MSCGVVCPADTIANYINRKIFIQKAEICYLDFSLYEFVAWVYVQCTYTDQEVKRPEWINQIYNFINVLFTIWLFFRVRIVWSAGHSKGKTNFYLFYVHDVQRAQIRFNTRKTKQQNMSTSLQNNQLYFKFSMRRKR